MKMPVAFSSFSVARAQDEEKPADDKDKEATRKLLAKAADEYRSYFKRPEKTVEFWAAIKFEMEVGKFDLAALHLKLLLEKMPEVHLVLAGDPSPAEQAHDELLRSLALDPRWKGRLHVLPAQAELAPLLKTLDVFVCPAAVVL